MQQLKSSRKQTKALWKLEKHKVVEKLDKLNISFTRNSEIKMQMHEIKGLPAVFFDDLLEEIGLETYEVLYNDPIFHYTQNLYNELSKHLPKI